VSDSDGGASLRSFRAGATFVIVVALIVQHIMAHGFYG
jgi:hypothetical protein